MPFLPVIYSVLLLLQILLLLLNLRKPLKKRWLLLLIAEALSETAAVLLMRYYNDLHGTGIMPGLTHFAETMYSMAAAAISGGMLVISAIVMAVQSSRQKSK